MFFICIPFISAPPLPPSLFYIRTLQLHFPLSHAIQRDTTDRPPSVGGPSGVPTTQPAPVLELEPASPPPSHTKLFGAVKRWAVFALSALASSHAASLCALSSLCRRFGAFYLLCTVVHKSRITSKAKLYVRMCVDSP